MGIAELNHRPTPNYPRFHLAFPVTELAEAQRFCGGFPAAPKVAAGTIGWSAACSAIRSSRTRSIVHSAAHWRSRRSSTNPLFATG
jgi:hypothetical protein